jgi:hypothetical protein
MIFWVFCDATIECLIAEASIMNLIQILTMLNAKIIVKPFCVNFGGCKLKQMQ